MPETPGSPLRELQQLSLDEPLRSPRTSSSTSYTQNINADIQARLLAFQEQRQSQSKNNSPQDEYDTSSPLHQSESSQMNNSASSTASPGAVGSPTMSSPTIASPLTLSQSHASQIEQQQQQIHELQRKRSLQMRKNKPLPPLPPSLQNSSLKTFSSTANSSSNSSAAPSLSSASSATTTINNNALSSRPPSHVSSKLNPVRPAPSLPINSQVSPQVAARLPKTKQSLSMRRGMKLPGGLPTLDASGSQVSSSNPSGSSASSSQQEHSSDLQGQSPASFASLTSSSSTSSPSALKSSVSDFIDKKGKLPPQQSMQLKGLFANYSKYIDIKSGSLNFAGKLSLDSKGVNFNGTKFSISADDLEFMEELGRGNYGTVSKVLHKPTGIIMAMKEVRLELDDSKFRQILMELEVLHKCNSPYIVDFYGAFFVEGAVYMCIEYMDGGSLDKIYGSGVDEPYLKYITDSVVKGLKELKDTHNVIHRDVKPTNILVDTSGKVKLCDFGVSGNLVASLAKTNIGCQSYMAPERIKSLTPDDVTYTVQSDIWSLGLTMLETAKGCYPYPPETYDNIFSQLSAIVDGEPPKLPEGYTSNAHDFVRHCLDKIPERRPNYSKLLQHPWLQQVIDQDEMSRYITFRIEEHKVEKTKQDEEDIKELNQKLSTPALHRGGAPQPQ